MVFIETPVFTKLVKDLLLDEEYRKLQEALLLRPESGALIPNGVVYAKSVGESAGEASEVGCGLFTTGIRQMTQFTC
jgi:hypothetical protein